MVASARHSAELELLLLADKGVKFVFLIMRIPGRTFGHCLNVQTLALNSPQVTNQESRTTCKLSKLFLFKLYLKS